MKRQLSVVAVIVGIAGVLALSLSSCAIQAVVTATGYVLNSSTGNGIPGATVTLTNPGTSSSYSVSPTASDGSYSIPLVAPGLYDVTVSGTSGYYFPPVQVTLQKGLKTIPSIPGVPLNSSTAGTISFILVWQNTSAPLDLQMTYPSTDMSSGNYSFTYPYDTTPSAWSSGFGPSIVPLSSNTGRAITNSTYPNGSNSNGNVTMGAMDYSTGGPVTINMTGFPFSVTNSAPSYTITASSTNGLDAFTDIPNTYKFLWFGAGELYITSSSTTSPVSSSDGTSGANPVVYVVQVGQNTSGAYIGELLGTFPVPNYTTIEAAGVVRVDFFTDSYYNGAYTDDLIVPDSEVVPGGAGTSGGSLRSVTSAPSIIGVHTKGR